MELHALARPWTTSLELKQPQGEAAKDSRKPPANVPIPTPAPRYKLAGFAYDAAKRAARFAAAKNAGDALIAAHRMQADALEIEAGAKRHLADEYDAAQERGEVASRGGERSGLEHSPPAPTAADIGISRKDSRKHPTPAPR